MKTLLMLLLALAMPVRAQDYPNKPVRVVVPYVAGGNAGFDMSQWQGVLAPAGTPRPIVERLNGAIVKAMHAPDVHERIAVQGGNDIVTGTPEEFAALIRADLERYGRLIRDAKISAQ